MTSSSTDALNKIARGSVIYIISAVAALVLQLFIRIIISQFGAVDYGIYSLALVVINALMFVSMLGLNETSAILISHYRAHGEKSKLQGTLFVSIQVTSIASIALSALLFLAAEYISINLFHAPELIPALRIFAVSLPFASLIYIGCTIFRGFDRVGPTAYFQNISINLIFAIILLLAVSMNPDFTFVYYAYLAALVITAVQFILYAIRKLPAPFFTYVKESDLSSRNEILVKSLPLLGVTLLSMVYVSMGTFMIGYFKSPADVGIYNAAYPLAQYIGQPLAALLIIYTPVAARLYARESMVELRRNYIVVTKWLVSITLPAALVLCMFPEAVINLFFGEEYVAAAPALCILSAGIMFRNLCGPNASTLYVMGHARFVMWSVLITVLLDIVGNLVLLPLIGITGSAVSYGVAMVMTHLLITLRLYQVSRIQPLSKNLAKPVLASIILALIGKFALSGILDWSWWMLVVLFIIYYALYGLVVVFTGSFDKEDVALLLDIEKVMGMNLTPVKKILSRFVKL